MWCGRLIHGACQEAGFSPNIVHEIDDYPATLNVVAAGAGVSLVPELGLAHQPEGLRVLDIAVPVLPDGRAGLPPIERNPSRHVGARRTLPVMWLENWASTSSRAELAPSTLPVGGPSCS